MNRALALVIGLALAACAAPPPDTKGHKDAPPRDTSLPSKASPGEYRVRLETTKGDVTLRVVRAWAPLGADRFRELVSSGFYGHVLYTGLCGIGIAYFVSRRDELPLRRRLSVVVGLFAAAVAAHFLWNSPLFNFFPGSVETVGDWLRIPLAAAIKGVPLLIFVVVLVRLARRRERMWLELALLEEADTPALTQAELRVLLDRGERRRSRREIRERAGESAEKLLKRLQKEQINLAMVRTRSHGLETTELVRQRELCKSLRDALRSMPGVAAAAGR